MKKLMIVLAIVAVFGLATAAQAALITFAGSDLTTDDAWHSTSVVKSLDADGDDVYGTDGHRAVTGNTEVVSVINPDYATSAFAAGGTFYGDSSKYGIDDPALAPAATVTDQFLAIVEYGGISGDKDVATITMTAAKSFRLGLTASTEMGSSALYDWDQIRVRQTTGGSADSGYVNSAAGDAAGVEYYFFDITGATGDVFTVSINGGDLGYIDMGALITFDTSGGEIPEPASLGLLGIAVLALRRRRA